MSPTFRLPDIGNSGYDEISFSFYLINKNNEWLERNFKFLHAFYAGTQWLQMDFGFIKGPNVYNVLCPGRFNLLWASVGSTITYVGKLRKNEWMVERYKNTVGALKDDMLWPDAWKIEIHIKDLTPNNFNTYMNYYANGADITFTTMRNLTEVHNSSLLSKIQHISTTKMTKDENGNNTDKPFTIKELINEKENAINKHYDKLRGNLAASVYDLNTNHVQVLNKLNITEEQRTNLLTGVNAQMTAYEKQQKLEKEREKEREELEREREELKQLTKEANDESPGIYEDSSSMSLSEKEKYAEIVSEQLLAAIPRRSQS